MRLARDLARGKKLSVEQAYTRLITHPERKELLAEVKREEARQRQMVSESRWPLHNAERQSQTKEWMRD
jgi:hypothetical protein